MLRSLLCASLGAGLVVATFGTASAQQPKEKAKAPPKIVVDDPAKLKDDKDFAIQGEYVGRAGTSVKDTGPVGAQLIARGGGEFEIRLYGGGLPGAGWDGKKVESFPIRTRVEDGKTILSKMGGNPADLAVLDGDTLTMPIIAQYKKTERKSPTLGAKPPEGAVVLWGDAADVAKWDKGKVAELSDGKFLSVSKAGDLRSKQAFGSFKAHVEFRLAWMPNSRGQGRSNSGVYFQDRYECQVLDSFGLKGENNECGGIYTQHKPSVNMCLPPMQWQTYDIEFTAAKFDGDKKTANARLTVLHNGVKIHDNVELPKECPGGKPEGPTAGPFRLQDHGDPVVYRNIWVVESK